MQSNIHHDYQIGLRNCLPHYIGARKTNQTLGAGREAVIQKTISVFHTSKIFADLHKLGTRKNCREGKKHLQQQHQEINIIITTTAIRRREGGFWER
jgi:hypothetical protein